MVQLHDGYLPAVVVSIRPTGEHRVFHTAHFRHQHIYPIHYHLISSICMFPGDYLKMFVYWGSGVKLSFYASTNFLAPLYLSLYDT